MSEARPVIIALASPKGGAGKTMAAILLACEAARNANRVLIIDADPQASASKWFEKSKGGGARLENIQCEIITDRIALVARLKTIRSFDVVFIDIQGTAEAAMTGALNFADLVVIPTRAHPADCRQAILMGQYVASMGGHDRSIPYGVLLNAVDVIEANSASARAARNMLRLADMPVFATELYNRVTFKNVAATGSLFEIEAPSTAMKTAQQNVVDLMNEIIGRIEGSGSDGG